MGLAGKPQRSERKYMRVSTQLGFIGISLTNKQKLGQQHILKPAVRSTLKRNNQIRYHARKITAIRLITLDMSMANRKHVAASQTPEPSLARLTGNEIGSRLSQRFCRNPMSRLLGRSVRRIAGLDRKVEDQAQRSGQLWPYWRINAMMSACAAQQTTMLSLAGSSPTRSACGNDGTQA